MMFPEKRLFFILADFPAGPNKVDPALFQISSEKYIVPVVSRKFLVISMILQKRMSSHTEDIGGDVNRRFPFQKIQFIIPDIGFHAVPDGFFRDEMIDVAK